MASHGGDEVKNLGDGLMVVFESPSDAIACGVAMQQGVEHHNRRAHQRIDLRVGLHMGEVTQEDEDYFGSAVVVAERLSKIAGPGQILVSDVLRLIVGSRGGHAFADVGPLDLKGVPDPVRAVEVGWVPTAAPAIPLPHALSTIDVNPFVGREDERQKLRDAFKDARGGVRKLVFLVGEPGMGKSRLCSEFAREVHELGATVLYGRCDEESLAPYQPFVEALQHYVASCASDELRLRVGPVADDIARLVPDLSRRLTDVAVQPISVEADADRLRLFDAVRALLTAASEEQTLVLVLDDLHWADRPTLQLVRHLLRSEPIPLLILATYRETDLDRAHPLSTVLADIRREHPFERLHLKGLDMSEIVLALERSAGHDVGRRGRLLAEALSRSTDGNPFFIIQILGHLTDTGRIYEQDGVWTFDVGVEELGIPEGVKEVIGRRVSALSDQANTALEVAAVIGRDFQLDILERVSDLTADELVDGLDEAVRAGIVMELQGAGRYSFAHALVRETLYEELTATRRVRLHRKVTEVLEDLAAKDADPDRYVSDLAYHLLEAAQAAEVDKTIDYARRAAALAVSLLAYEEGARLYERALQAMDLGNPDDDQLRCELLIGLGDAQWKFAGYTGSAETLDRALEIAESLRDPELIARSAIAAAGPPEQVRGDYPHARPLELALDLLPDGDSTTRANVLARLATSYPLNESELRAGYAREALAMARRLQDERTLAMALRSAMIASWRPDNVDEELEMALEVVRLAESNRDKELELFGYGWRGIHLLHVGDIDGVDADIDRMSALVGELKQSFSSWTFSIWRVTRLMLSGRLDEAETLAAEALDLGQRNGNEVAMAGYAAQLTVLRWLQGRLDELEAMLNMAAQQLPDVPAFRCSLALLYAESDRPQDAKAALDELAPDRFVALTLDGFWLVGVSRLAEVCATIGDIDHASVLYELLLPYSSRNITSGGAISASGSASRVLGRLSATLGRWNEAEAHFAYALEHNERMGARPFAAMTLYDHARLLMTSEDRDVSRAHELLDRALPIAQEIGMKKLEARIVTAQEMAPVPD